MTRATEIATTSLDADDLRRVVGPVRRQIPREYFGLHFNNAYSGDTSPVTPIVDHGHGCVRFWDNRLTWRLIEPTEGGFVWTRFDELVTAHRNAGKSILYCLGQAPAWATGGEVGGVGLTTSIYNSLVPDDDAWVAYCAAVATRYAGRIEAYEIWNEHSTVKFWAGTDEDIARLTILASETIRAIDPAAKIVSSAPSASEGPPALYSYLSEPGVVEALDVVGCHLYVQPSQPDAVLDLACAFRSAADAAGAGALPLWCTEVGVTQYYSTNVFYSDTDTTMIPTDLGVSYLFRYLALPWLGGVERLYWYGVDVAACKLILVDKTTPATKLPTGEAYKIFADELTGSFPSALRSAAGIKVFSYAKADGQRKAVGWAADNDSVTVDFKKLGVSAVQRDTAATGLFADIDRAGSAEVVTRSPVLLGMSSVATDDRVDEFLSTPPVSHETYNYDFSRQRQSGSTPDGWTASVSVSSYSGNVVGREYAITLTASAQNQLFRQTHRNPLGQGRYCLVLRYRLPESQTSEWYLGLEDVNGIGNLLGTTVSRSLFASEDWVEERREFVIATDTYAPTPFRILLINTGASGWHPIDVSYLGVQKLDPLVVENPRNARLVRTPVKPSKGGITLNQEDQYEWTSASLVSSEGARGQIVSAGGTLGTLSGVTASLTNASRTISNVSPDNSLKAGDYVNFAGGTKFQILEKINASSYRLDGNYDGSAASGVAVQYVNPTIIKYGLIAASDGKPILTAPVATTAPSSGAMSALPAPEKVVRVNVSGVDYWLPLYKV